MSDVAAVVEAEAGAKAPPPMPPHVVQAYKDAVDNIMFLKKQQWQVTNYYWIAQTAILFLSTHAASSLNVKRFLIFSSVLAMLAIVATLFILQFSMKKFRDRLTYFYCTYFSEDDIIGLGVRKTKKHLLHDPFILIILVVASIVGGITVTLLIWWAPLPISPKPL